MAVRQMLVAAEPPVNFRAAGHAIRTNLGRGFAIVDPAVAHGAPTEPRLSVQGDRSTTGPLHPHIRAISQEHGNGSEDGLPNLLIGTHRPADALNGLCVLFDEERDLKQR